MPASQRRLHYQLHFVLYYILTTPQVSFVFAARVEGESKLTGKVIVYYLMHLKELYLFSYFGVLVVLFLLLVASGGYVVSKLL